MTRNLKVESRTYHSSYGWSHKQVKCPVCKEWKRDHSLKQHMKKSEDELHIDFVKKYTKVVTQNVLDVNFITT